jgi:hypothetical protein
MVKIVLPLPPRPAARRGAVSAGLDSGGARALIVRLCAGAWFFVLSAASFSAVSGQIADIAAGRASLTTAWPALLSEGCNVLFYTIICCIMLLRPEPVSRAGGIGPALLALAGTYGTWLIPLLPRGPEHPALVCGIGGDPPLQRGSDPLYAPILGPVVQPDPPSAQAGH